MGHALSHRFGRSDLAPLLAPRRLILRRQHSNAYYVAGRAQAKQVAVAISSGRPYLIDERETSRHFVNISWPVIVPHFSCWCHELLPFKGQCRHLFAILDALYAAA